MVLVLLVNMEKSNLIKAAANLSKVAYGFPGQGNPDAYASSTLPAFQTYDNLNDPYATPGSALGTGLNVGIAGLMGYGNYNNVRALQGLRAGTLTQPQFSAKVLGGGIGSGAVSKGLGRIALPLTVGLSAYGAGSAAMDLNRGFRDSQFNTGKGFQGGNQLRYALGTTEGRNKLADVATGGGMTLAGAGIGAGIGAAFGGVGAIPGAMIGATLGGLAELGTNAYRSATGWDSNKYNAAKNIYSGNASQGDYMSLVDQAHQGKGIKNLFESKTLFGKRDLGEEAYKDSIKR
jgi:hypothetical protein